MDLASGARARPISPCSPTGANTFTDTQTIFTGNLDLDGSSPNTGTITKNGTRFLHDFGGGTFLGRRAGNFTMLGYANTAIGEDALSLNTGGHSNTAIGEDAMEKNSTGTNNTAVGLAALFNNTTGTNNSALGVWALHSNTAGYRNTAMGWRSLSGLGFAGNDNVAIGSWAGFRATGSNNIYIGSDVYGAAGESNTIRLGAGAHARTFMGGIRGVTTGINNGTPVVIDSDGQLGTISSSRRFKQDIHDMADASRRVLQLRPVTFRYTQGYSDGSKPVQYGLIAEEVAETFPELAVRNAEGGVETVHYETLNVLLLNELQKQERRIEALERQLKVLLGRQ